MNTPKGINAIEKAIDEWNVYNHDDWENALNSLGKELNKIAIPKDVLREKIEFCENNADWICPKLIKDLLNEEAQE